jgi:cytochrome b
MPKPARTDRADIVAPDADGPIGTVRVWDRLVRIFHWTLVLSFVTAWLTAGWAEELHQLAGFYAAGSIVLRVIWGVWGTLFARFSQFVRGPAIVIDYLRAMSVGREERYIGHNPAGGAMVVTLMGMIITAVITGWMMTTDTYFGVAWVGILHSLVVHGLAVLVLVHLAGVAIASFRHKENLVMAMITGRKRAV